ncbi:MAG: class I SAM-dependent methyltransferase [Burkholderiales bacterium]|nr:class I SAM-dependent methyltransferase [Burkholderiales bacterium]
MPCIATQCICCASSTLERQSAVLMPFVALRALGWEPCEITADWGLRDLPLGHAHALCSSLHCPACGSLFLDMRFDSAEMARLYRNYRGADYEAQRERFEPGYIARNRALLAGDAHIPQVESFLRPWLPDHPAVLDWGGDTGLNTPLRHEAGLHHVLDISGRPLVAGAIAVDAPQLRYDLIVLAHVLEHVPEPDALIGEVAQAMDEGTRLYVEVPFERLMQEIEDRTATWQRKRHWHEHINFFSPAGLRSLLQRCGLSIDAEARLALDDRGGMAMAMLCRRG